MNNPYLVKSDKRICKFVSIMKNGDNGYIFKIINEEGHLLPAQLDIYFTQESLTESEEISFLKELSVIKFLSSIQVQLQEIFYETNLKKINPEKRNEFKQYIRDDFNRVCIQLETFFNTKISVRLEFKFKDTHDCDISIIPLDGITRGIFEDIYSLGKNR